MTELDKSDVKQLKETLEIFVDEHKNWNDNSLEETLDNLQLYSLVEVTGEGLTLINIHPLVHAWSYELLSRKEQKQVQICAQQLFYLICKGGVGYYDAVQWVIHLQHLLRIMLENDIDVKAAEAMQKKFQEIYM